MGRKTTIDFKRMTRQQKVEYHRSRRRLKGIMAIDYVGLKAMSPERRRRYDRAVRYGLTVAEYEARMAVGRCEACDATDRLVLDHHHATGNTKGRYRGRTRGVLCTSCNSALA